MMHFNLNLFVKNKDGWRKQKERRKDGTLEEPDNTKDCKGESDSCWLMNLIFHFFYVF